MDQIGRVMDLVRDKGNMHPTITYEALRTGESTG